MYPNRHPSRSSQGVDFLGEEVIVAVRSRVNLKRFISRLLVPTLETRMISSFIDCSYCFLCS